MQFSFVFKKITFRHVLGKRYFLCGLVFLLKVKNSLAQFKHFYRKNSNSLPLAKL